MVVAVVGPGYGLDLPFRLGEQQKGAAKEKTDGPGPYETDRDEIEQDADRKPR